MNGKRRDVKFVKVIRKRKLEKLFND